MPLTRQEGTDVGIRVVKMEEFRCLRKNPSIIKIK